MSMEYKAHIFDYEAFVEELADILFLALAEHKIEGLEAFINLHRQELRDLSTGEPLSDTWAKELRPRDTHDLGDIALTKYYDLYPDVLIPGWMELDDCLNKV